MKSCQVCGDRAIEPEFESLNQYIDKHGKCYSCLRREREIERLDFMASALNRDERLVFRGLATDVVPFGNFVYPILFALGSKGFEFSFPDSPERDSEFFEWGEQLYAGPKSYNKFASIRDYRAMSEEIGLDDTSFRAATDMDPNEMEYEDHHLAQQELAFVITCGEDYQSSIDRWISLECDPVGFTPSVPEAPSPSKFPISELNALFRDFSFMWWTDGDDKPMPNNLGAANQLDGLSGFLRSLTPNQYELFRMNFGRDEFDLNVGQIEKLFGQEKDELIERFPELGDGNI